MLMATKNVKLLASGIDRKEDIAYSMYAILKSCFLLRQQPVEALDSYLNRFSSIIDTDALVKSNIELHQGVIDVEKECNSGGRAAQQQKSAKETFKAMIFLMNANERTYKKSWTDLRNNMALESNRYPKTVAAAH